ncbi:putative septum site-determining protein MinC [uncultured Gammaproteobacteria bacterium]
MQGGRGVTGNERNAERDGPFQVRGGSYTMVVLKLIDPSSRNFFPLLGEKVRQAPNFFRNAPIVLDLEELSQEREYFDFVGMIRRLREYQMIAVGVQGGGPRMRELALASGLAILPPGRGQRGEGGFRAENAAKSEAEAAAKAEVIKAESIAKVEAGVESEVAAAAADRAEPQDRSAETASPPAVTGAAALSLSTTQQSGQQSGSIPGVPSPPVPPPSPPSRITLIVTEPVRSGRQLYAAGGDMVVMAPVSAGGELLADGSIHVYGPLRGRAMAGLSGDTNARIFCMSLEAELVSVAGIYRLNETIEPLVYKKPAQVYLDNGYLRLQPF